MPRRDALAEVERRQRKHLPTLIRGMLDVAEGAD
jgi:hypothetical protein